MQYIKKTFKLDYAVNKIDSNTIEFIPNTGSSYNLKVLLVQDTCDMGFFDVYDTSGTTINVGSSYVVTGSTSSNLNQIKKAGNPSKLINRYYTSTTDSINGLDLTKSYKYTGITLNTQIPIISLTGLTGTTNYKFIYYIDKITYIEYSGSTLNQVSCSFLSSGYNNNDFINSPMIKDESKGSVIQNPHIDSDVFIIREELSAFEKNYNLEFVKNLSQLTSFAAGKYFKIVNNS